MGKGYLSILFFKQEWNEGPWQGMEGDTEVPTGAYLSSSHRSDLK